MFTSLIRAALLSGIAVFAWSAAYSVEPVEKLDPAKPVGAIVTDAPVHAAGVLSPEQNDRQIVRWLTVDNRGLVDCAKIAADHSSNEGIKNFAREVASEHETFLKTFGTRDEKREENAATDQRQQTATLVRDEGRSRAGGLFFKPTDFVAVKEQICKEMQRMAKKEIESLSGPEFDHAFLAHTVFGHEALVASVDALDVNATDTLKPQLKSLRAMLERHLARAQDLQTQLTTGSTAARSGTSEVK